MESFGDGPLVVLAGDDPEQYARVAQWLRDAGMRPVVCPDAETFIDNLELRPPDVVCMDLGLPGLGGRQALDAVRRRHPHVPVVVLTGDTCCRDRRRCHAPGRLRLPAQAGRARSAARGAPQRRSGHVGGTAARAGRRLARGGVIRRHRRPISADARGVSSRRPHRRAVTSAS